MTTRVRNLLVPPLVLGALAAMPTTTASAQTPPVAPELSGRIAALPVGLRPGASGAADIVLENIGAQTASASVQRLWLSVDDQVDASDTLLGADAVDLPPGQTARTVPITVPSAVGPGEYTVLLEIDADGDFTEIDETDNLVAASPFSTAENFTAESVRVSPNAVELLDPVRVQAQPRNVGLPFTGNVAFGVYLSLDDTWDPGDQRVYQGLTFYPGTDTGVAIDVTFPLAALPGTPQLRPGTYRVIVRVDDGEIVVEADETDNAAGAPGGTGRLDLLGADLVVNDVDGPQVTFIGRTAHFSLEIENQGVADATGFTYSWFLSDNDIIRVTNDARIFTSPPVTLAAGASAAFEDTITIPTRTSTACMWFGVIVNDRGQVAETNVNNNARRIFDCIDVLFPTPNITARIVSTPTVAAAGEDMAVTRLLINDGTADAETFEYTYYVSSNPQITPTDIPVGTFSTAVPEATDDYGIDVLSIPSTLAAGDYFLGLIVDPADRLTEVNEDDNVAVGPQLPFFSAAIQISTSALPDATVGVPYDFGLFASSAPLALRWSIAQGSLPEGLSLDADSGIISGQPQEEGLAELVVRASAGTAFADKPLSLRVLAPTVPLRVASSVLPSAVSGREYEARLVAVGGQVPYTWQAVSSLPVGLELSEDGVLFGTPATPGAFAITVRVVDAVGDSASKEVALNVITANQTLQIVQLPLPSAVTDQDYCDPEPIRFEVQNGTAPYSWSVVDEAPPGLSLDAEGRLCGTPTQAGTFPFVVRVQDRTGLFDTSLFVLDVGSSSGTAITTFNLEDGQVGEPYEATLTAIRGTEPYRWAVVEGAGPLPAGLRLEPTGALRGVPEEPGRYAFVVQVTDAVNRVDVQPLSIEIAPEPQMLEQPEGCSAAGASAELAAAWALLGLLALGRRRR